MRDTLISSFFADVEHHNGFYIVRGAKSLNPRVVEAKKWQGPHSS